MDKYQEVEHAHVVQCTYLRNFADADERIGMRLLDDPTQQTVISIRDAAARRRFYRRIRPDGTPIDDVEWALGLIEGPAGPILREVEQRWPLTFDDKRVLGEFFALQILRSPRWRQGYEVRSGRLPSEYRASELFAEARRCLIDHLECLSSSSRRSGSGGADRRRRRDAPAMETGASLGR